MPKALVLGGAGFIGFNIVEKLSSLDDYEVTICDNLSRGRQDEHMDRLLVNRPAVNFVNADLTDVDSYALLGTEYDQVYLLAGVVGVRYTSEMPDKVVYTNAMITLLTLEWLKTFGTAKVLFSSTSEVYAGAAETIPNFPIPTPEDVPLAIDDITNTRFSYAASKMLGEAAVVAYQRINKLPATIVRYHNVFGPRMGYEHVIPELSMRLLRKEEPFLVYGCDQFRAFCYISDAVDATIAAMESEATNSGEISHIGRDEETQIGVLAQHLCDLAGFHPELRCVPAPTGSTSRRCPDISKARNLLGYEPKVGLEEGLKKTFEWYSDDYELSRS